MTQERRVSTSPHLLRTGTLALLLTLAGTAAAQPVAHYWYEGGQRRPLRLDSAHVADFTARGPQVLKAAPSAAAKSVAGAATKGASPVFRDAGSGDGSARALPGGMLVTLKHPMDDAQARAWFAARGLTAVRRIGTTATWLVQTDAGLASLTAANALHESGEVAGAEPNWWQQRALK